MSADLETVRAQIDALDAQIVALIAERQRCVEQAGRLKTDRAAVPAPDRVEQVIGKVRSLAEQSGADPEVVDRTYRAMVAAFIELELGVHDESAASVATGTAGAASRSRPRGF